MKTTFKLPYKNKNLLKVYINNYKVIKIEHINMTKTC